MHLALTKYFHDSESGAREWLSSEALELIDIFESHYYLFGVMSTDEDVWILLASALQRKGIEVTARQVSQKWLRMRETFNKISKCKAATPPTLRHYSLHAARNVRISSSSSSSSSNHPCNNRNTQFSAYGRELDVCSDLRTVHSIQRDNSYENLKHMYDLSTRM